MVGDRETFQYHQWEVCHLLPQTPPIAQPSPPQLQVLPPTRAEGDKIPIARHSVSPSEAVFASQATSHLVQRPVMAHCH